MESKGWNWNEVKNEWWKIPADEVIPLSIRWEKLNKKRVLDLGCGIGRHSELFAEKNFDVLAFDISPEGIENITKLINEKKLKIETKIGDMQALPYDDNRFNSILAFHVIYHTDKNGIRKIIKEIERVLEKEGELYITFNSINNPSYSNPKNEIIDKYTRVKTEGVEKGIPHYYVNESELRELLINFEIIKLQHIEDICEDDRSWHYFVLARKK